MRFRTTIAAGLAGLALFATTAVQAAENLLSYIPEDAEFAASVNVREVLNSGAFKHVWDNVIKGEQYQNQIEAFEGLTDVKIMEDIERFVVGGRIEQEESIALLVQGNLPIEKLISFLKLSPEYATEEINGLTVHSWDPGDPKVATVLPDNSILLCGTKERLQECLRSASAGGRAHERFGLPAALETTTAWAWVAPTEANREINEVRRIFGVESGLATLNLRESNVEARLTVHADTIESTRLIENIAKGFTSLVQLQRESPDLQRLSKAAVVTRDDSQRAVSLGLAMEIEELVKTVETLSEL